MVAKGASLSEYGVDSTQKASIPTEPREQIIVGIKGKEPTCNVRGLCEEVWELSGHPDNERVTNGGY